MKLFLLERDAFNGVIFSHQTEQQSIKTTDGAWAYKTSQVRGTTHFPLVSKGTDAKNCLLKIVFV